MGLSYPVVIAQYKRNDYGVGEEEHFHWALVIIQDKQTLAGYAMQAVDRTVRGWPTVWQMDCRAITSLSRSSKCLGGVQVATIEHSAVDMFVQAVHEYGIEPSRRSGWRCRDYIWELVAILKIYGSVEGGRLDEAALLSALRHVSRQSYAQSTAARECMPHIQWSGLPTTS